MQTKNRQSPAPTFALMPLARAIDTAGKNAE